MGFLHYGTDVFPMEDRTLLHVQIAVHEVAKHKSAFYLTWLISRESGSGRVSAWVTPGVQMLFVFEGNRPARINRMWIDALVQGARDGHGITLQPEPPLDLHS